MAEKQYGLIKPQKPSSRLMAFASDNESDDEPVKKRVSTEASTSQKRQARVIQEDALKEDPTIFQYDEVYDDINATREEAKKAKTTEARDSKYISRLLVTAEKRKLEHESRLERKIQKEREAEGDMYKDKEVFVTSSYRAKLEAMKKAEEEAKREEYLEGIGDVRKQNDLSGFYRHMYEQKMGGPEKAKEEEEEKKIDKEPDREQVKIDIKPLATSKRRAYRKHDENESEEEEEEPSPKNNKKQNNEKSMENKKVHLQSNLDADSDFSIDSDDSEAENENSKSDKNPKSSANENNTTDGKPNLDKVTEKLNEENGTKTESSEKNGDNLDKEKDDKGSGSDGEKMPPPAPKPKIDVWKKRTVGDVHLAAVQRYYERKQSAST